MFTGVASPHRAITHGRFTHAALGSPLSLERKFCWRHIIPACKRLTYVILKMHCPGTALMLDTSVSLLERIASHSQDKDWDRLLSIYRPFIDSQVRRYPQLIDQADDISQEIAMVLVRELPQFQRQRDGSFRVWLRQVAVNQIRNASRKQKGQPIPLGNSPTLDEQLDDLSNPASIASKRWDDEHDREVLRRVIEIVREEVNPTHWIAFQAHVLDGKSADLVSREMGITINLVHLAKSRITKRMQSEVKGLIGP